MRRQKSYWAFADKNGTNQPPHLRGGDPEKCESEPPFIVSLISQSLCLRSTPLSETLHVEL